jgi:DNA-binding NarL/FixJ family response regulator
MNTKLNRKLCRVNGTDSSFGVNGGVNGEAAAEPRAAVGEAPATTTSFRPRSDGHPVASPGAGLRRLNGSRISLVIADDHPITLTGLDALFAREPDLVVLGRCAEAYEVVRAVTAYHPDILVVDQDMPGMDGVTIVKHLRREGLETRVVLLAAADSHQVREALRLGVPGVLYKNVDPRLLVRCVREVYAGRTWIDPSLASPAVEKTGVVQALDGLTPRQVEVACAAVSGLSNKELAQRLGVSEGTIKNHLHAIYERLQLDGRLALLLYLKERALA